MNGFSFLVSPSLPLLLYTHQSAVPGYLRQTLPKIAVEVIKLAYKAEVQPESRRGIIVLSYSNQSVLYVTTV